ncbi:hypothetical protein NBH00_05195 [Paraconexibacter antarcticus]|uniref:Uncharacterized protein n=1 Tax=Paraconexibacter antarcticus TaxID=2949664 RepID=A0ABY5DVB3_9ACTN|nr:hypothetical protein [Paraconexibacter antarcticus]UTI65606.1 hypothetical protein NBH00_05195 [Paraconexibacter antarcticus]
MGATLPDFDTNSYLPRAQAWVNDGLREIARRTNIPALDMIATVALVPGTNAYNLPTDSIRVRSLVDPLYIRELDQIDIGDIDSLVPLGSEPIYYALFDNQLVLYPTPSSARNLTLRYQALPGLLAGTDLQATIPDDYSHLIVCFVRARLFRAEDDYEAAGVWLAEFERLLGHLRADLQRQAPFKVRQIRGRTGMDVKRRRI